MADITVTVSSPSDSVNITVPSSDSALNVTVREFPQINVDISPNVAYQGLTNLLDVQGTPTDNQMIVWDEDEGAFVFIDLLSGSGDGDGAGGVLADDIDVTNDDDAFSHLVGYTYDATDIVSLESILRDILDPPTATTVNFSALSPTSDGTYEVGTTNRSVAFISFSNNSVAGLAGGVSLKINGSGGYDPIVPSVTANTSYAIQHDGGDFVYNAASTVYTDKVFGLSYNDAVSINNLAGQSNELTIKIRVRHLFYGSTTELAQGAIQSDIQNLYDAIVTASSSLSSEQLVDRTDDYTYSNTGNKYNLEVDDTYTYYFYEASLGDLTDIKLGGSQGLDIDDAFIHITNGGAVSLSNGEVSTDYHVYRSRNKKAFTSGQSIYFKN